MLSDLKIVQGALSTKNFTPILKSFRISNGWVIGSNSRMSIMKLIPELAGLNITVPAERFIKAINACNDEPKLTVSDSGNLSVTAGKFRARIPLQNNDDYPMPQLTGETVEGVNMLESLKTIQQFIGSDITRPWACGCLFENGYLYATNNTAIVRVPFTGNIPTVNLPAHAVTELLRIKQEPISMRVTDNVVSMELADGTWLQSTLVDSKWPDTTPLFDYPFDQLPELPAGLLQAVEQVTPFCKDPKFPRIHFGEHGVSTEQGDYGASVEGLVLPEGTYRAEPLTQALQVATHGDFTGYPRPCPFTGVGGVQGVIIGLKVTVEE